MPYLLPALLLAACAQPSDGINWHTWAQAAAIDGLMRTERSPQDALVTRQLLVDNFRRIAFEFEEDALGTGKPLKGQKQEPHLRKWSEAIQYRVVASPVNAVRALDKISPFMVQLQSITGLPILLDLDQPALEQSINLAILYGTDDEFALVTKASIDLMEIDESTRSLMLGLAEFFSDWRYAPSPCAGTVYATPRSDPQTDPQGTILFAVIVIKRDIPDELFESCVEEELAQVLGLLNDDPEVRPSLFNDDQEFALLTDHDKYLLQILYDDRLEPGMTPEVAMPIVRQIVDELLPAS